MSDKKKRSQPTKIEKFLEDRIFMLAAGNEHSLVLSEKGVLFTFGSNKKCQLGAPSEQISEIVTPTPSQWLPKEWHLLSVTARADLSLVISISENEPNQRSAHFWGGGKPPSTHSVWDESLSCVSIASEDSFLTFFATSHKASEEQTEARLLGKRMRRREQMGAFSLISANIVRKILFLCDHKDLCRLSQVNTLWKEFAEDDSLWKPLALRDIENDRHTYLLKSAQTKKWKVVYEMCRPMSDYTPFNKSQINFFKKPGIFHSLALKLGVLKVENSSVKMVMLGLDAAGKNPQTKKIYITFSIINENLSSKIQERPQYFTN